MRHEYVGDIGDFGKYALLKALAGHNLTLGVVWCLNAGSESNNDGLFTSYDRLRPCDPELHDRLQTIIRHGKRSLGSIESGSVLPERTIFFSNPVPFPVMPCLSSATRANQCALRQSWHWEGLRSLNRADLVFLDPDNGLAGRVQRHSRRGVKYVFREEVIDWLSRGKSVVLYQHQQRRSLREQVRDQLPKLGEGWALTFHRTSVRIYYVLPASKEHKALLISRTRAFLESEWGRNKHFRLSSLPEIASRA